MNVLVLCAEIGIVSMIDLLEACDADVAQELAVFLPRSQATFARYALSHAADVLEGIGKLMLLVPEVAFMEQLAQVGYQGEVHVVVPYEFDPLVADRISRNVPEGVNAVFIQEGEFPSGFQTGDGVIVCFGVVGRRSVDLTPHAARMLSYYGEYAGDKIVVGLSPFGQPGERPLGWTSVPMASFTVLVEESK